MASFIQMFDVPVILCTLEKTIKVIMFKNKWLFGREALAAEVGSIGVSS